MIRLHELSGPEGSRKDAKRVGRGIGSAHGKTSGRGHKGQRARGKVRPGFEGGQTPINRRLRKLKGESQSARNIGMFKKEYTIINVGQLEQFDANTVITPELLLKTRFISTINEGLRVLGNGELTKPLTVYASHFSASAADKIKTAGGSAEVI